MDLLFDSQAPPPTSRAWAGRKPILWEEVQQITARGGTWPVCRTAAYRERPLYITLACLEIICFFTPTPALLLSDPSALRIQTVLFDLCSSLSLGHINRSPSNLIFNYFLFAILQISHCSIAILSNLV